MLKKRYILLPLLFLIIICNFMVRRGNVDYATLIKPNFAPPLWMFILIWSIIYIILYLSTVDYFKKQTNYRSTLILYYILLTSHFLWMFFFFICNFQLVSIFMLIAVYIISISYILTLAQKNKKAFWANLFYLLWLLYALLLNISIFYLNS